MANLCPKCGKPYDTMQHRTPRYPKGATRRTEYWHRMPGPDLALPGFGRVPQYQVCSIPMEADIAAGIDMLKQVNKAIR